MMKIRSTYIPHLIAPFSDTSLHLSSAWLPLSYATQLPFYAILPPEEIEAKYIFDEIDSLGESSK